MAIHIRSQVHSDEERPLLDQALKLLRSKCSRHHLDWRFSVGEFCITTGLPINENLLSDSEIQNELFALVSASTCESFFFAFLLGLGLGNGGKEDGNLDPFGNNRLRCSTLHLPSPSSRLTLKTGMFLLG